MKKLIFCLLLFGFISAGHSQILLKEAKVDYRPESMKIDPHSNSFVFNLPEKSVGEFEKDPLAYMKKNFDIQKVLTDNKDSEYDQFNVNFKTRKGRLAARFDKNGELISTFQKFRNIRLPENTRLKIMEKYRDAIIVSNKYVASTKGWDMKKEIYIVKITDGDKNRKVRINQGREVVRLTGL